MYLDFSRDGCLRFLCSEDAKKQYYKNDLEVINKHCEHLVKEIVPPKARVDFEKIIGLGGEAASLLCYDNICKRLFVLKVAFPDANAQGIRTVYKQTTTKALVEHFNIIRERYIRGGAQIQSALSLEISRVFGFIPIIFSASEFPVYVSMEFFDSVDPVSFYKDSNFKIKFEFFYRLLTLVSICHSYNIIHRDIKPSNILVVEDNGIQKPCLLDWTFSKQFRGDAESIPTMDLTAQSNYNLQIDSHCFSSPKFVAGGAENANFADDVYSLGKTMYCILLGHIPKCNQDFNSRLEPVELVNGSVLEASKLPVDLISIYNKATHDDERQRYPTVSEFLVALEHYAQSSDIIIPELKVNVPEKKKQIQEVKPMVSAFNSNATTKANKKAQRKELNIDLSKFSRNTQNFVYNLSNIINHSDDYFYKIKDIEGDKDA